MSSTGTKTTGTSTADDWSNANCYASLSTVLSQMSAGDELVIDDGTYTGTTNQIWHSSQYPPDGTVGAYTVIRARNEGSVHFDGENTRFMFLYFGDVAGAMQYVEFRGIVWSNGSGDNNAAMLTDSSYVKFIRCGFKDSGGDATDDNEATFSVFRSSYILAEECYAWGNGRYKFLSYSSDHIIFRRCVARFDYCYEENEPKAVFSLYNSDYVEVQNCIAIDGDTRTSWPATTQNNQVDGCFYAPNNTNYSTYINVVGSIALNNDLPFASTSGDGSQSEGGPVLFENCVGYDVWDGSVSFNANNTDIKHSTFGGFTHPNWGHDTSEEANNNYGFNFYNSGTDDEFDDNIIFDVTGIMTTHYVIHGGQLSSLDNNCFYNVVQSDETIAYGSDTNTVTTNPETNGLLYLVRIEDGSNLANAGIGATILKKIGVSGTLWGETGYDAVTEDDLWPFPHEDVIRANMRTYTAHSVDGTRGFCATGQTLTKYIWEYLGNTIPDSIYGLGETSINRSGGGGVTVNRSGGGSVTISR